MKVAPPRRRTTRPCETRASRTPRRRRRWCWAVAPWRRPTLPRVTGRAPPGAGAGGSVAALRVGELPPTVDHMIGLAEGARLGFERPVWLLLLLVTPLLFAVLRRSLADFSAGQLALQAGLRTLLVAGVAAALAGPSWRRPARAVSATVLLDVSDSVPEAGLIFERA